MARCVVTDVIYKELFVDVKVCPSRCERDDCHTYLTPFAASIDQCQWS